MHSVCHDMCIGVEMIKMAQLLSLQMEHLKEDSSDHLQVSVPLKSNRSPQFHVAVYYNNLEPITMEAVKNKHGCYVYSGMYINLLCST